MLQHTATHAFSVESVTPRSTLAFLVLGPEGNVAHMNESRLTYKRVMSHKWKQIYTPQPRTHKCVMSHTYTSRRTLECHVARLNAMSHRCVSRLTFKRHVAHVYVTSHKNMSRLTHVCYVSRMDVSLHKCMSRPHIWMSRLYECRVCMKIASTWMSRLDKCRASFINVKSHDKCRVYKDRDTRNIHIRLTYECRV